jgi:hypothetical protein
MPDTDPANNPSSEPSTTQDHTDVAAEVDNYMAAVDRVVASITLPTQLCPYHEQLLAQNGFTKKETCCVLQAWFNEKGHEQLDIFCLVDSQWLSISKPCTLASIMEARMRIACCDGQA